jgi:hypothetical protein
MGKLRTVSAPFSTVEQDDLDRLRPQETRPPACPIDPWRSSMVIRRPSENRESGHAPSRGPLIRSVPNETTPPRSPDPDGAAWFPGVVVEPDSSAIPAVPSNRHSEPD